MLFLFQSEAEFPELPGLRLTFLDLGTDTAKFDVTLFIAETDEGLVLAVEYNWAYRAWGLRPFFHALCEEKVP